MEFLEGIQTHFRNRNVFYVVAADKNWLRSAFEQHYEGFQSDLIKSADHPLGLLFLEKIFQLSIGVPDVSEDRLKAYWKGLLDDQSEEEKLTQDHREGWDGGAASGAGHGDGSGAERDAVSGDGSGQGVPIDSGSEEDKRTKHVLDAVRSGVADKQAKHLLTQLNKILPNNPRSLKRMVNLYSIYLVSREIVGAEEKELPTLTMARWIIFEQRFLELSEALLAEPGRLVELIHGRARRGGNGDIISRYSGDEDVRAVLGYTGKTEEQITDDHIKILKKFG